MIAGKLFSRNVQLVVAEGISFTNRRSIYMSAALCHNPSLKKKTKSVLDSARFEKQIQKQEERMRKKTISPPFDPDSVENPVYLEANRQRQQVELSKEEQESRVLLQKEWAKYQMARHKTDLRILGDKLKSRKSALKELKKESEFLYAEAIKVDKGMFPLRFKGPMDTPPNPEHSPPDFVDEKRLV